MRMRSAAASVLGGRAVNQDACHADEHLLVVADGVGGGPAGDVASRVAVAAVVESGLPPLEAAKAANTAVLEHASRNAATLGMATTLEMARLVDGVVHGGHVGDSITYVETTRITRPHNLGDELVAAGHLTPEQAARHPQRAALVRAVGLDAEVEPDGWTRDAVPGERYLLCSDGLTDALGDDLAPVLAALRHLGPQECVDELIRLALEAGPRDNVTVVIADVE